MLSSVLLHRNAALTLHDFCERSDACVNDSGAVNLSLRISKFVISDEFRAYAAYILFCYILVEFSDEVDAFSESRIALDRAAEYLSDTHRGSGYGSADIAAVTESVRESCGKSNGLFSDAQLIVSVEHLEH